ncbi:MAG: 4-(cytidine 5'-diphospho)-2-C-methyl-D-erythritol kinase [Oscillospiraceae bacterium]|nr:4-(cytidine 5'-diphospho)-2-C-methyl-D-erythritol kinase [Oscillospiraceae bacterium]
MDVIKVKASAKINLTLDVTGRRDDGYHLIESVFQSIGIFDILTVKKTPADIKISCDDEDVPCDMRNIAYKAALLFFEYTGISGGAEIHIEKHIPSQAGLGGGSSDGAGVLYALNKLYNTNMTVPELASIGGRISADTAFFIYGGTAFVRGIGEKICAIRSLPPVNLVIAKGRAGISTPEAYGKIDTLVDPHHPDTKGLVKAIDEGKFLKKCDLCENMFELVTDTRDVFDIKKYMLDYGAEAAVMSGSGSSVFGIFENEKKALKCVENLKKYFCYAEYCTAVTQSIYEL